MTTPNRLQSLPLSGLKAVQVILEAGTRSASVRGSRAFARVLSKVDDKDAWPLSLDDVCEALQAIVDDEEAGAEDRKKARRALKALEDEDDESSSGGGALARLSREHADPAAAVRPLTPEAQALFDKTNPFPRAPAGAQGRGARMVGHELVLDELPPEQSKTRADELAKAWGFR